ncbi:glycosyltransferase [Isoptericola dokdonensis]|uniref:Putative glycosyltransferase EpsH n=1 Tax=Isoptericola dokdonensis DS-3 TaxID=1300344 RepID=A0A161IKJ5_9MICO|nr:glycosyltransferase family A protein [Isoptericola dokdonensis]ANC32714.1 Putative glycosyltransferase EpsH [Isoptericola dokdonensis DS-3]
MTQTATGTRAVPTPPLPTVTVVVPVYEDLDRLRTCLRLLGEQDYPGDLDVVVADNGSSSDLRPALPPDDARFRLVREERPGSYAARNAGLAVATGDVVAFTDADCRPRPDWLTRAVAALQGPEAPDAVGGRINLVFRDGVGPATGPELYEALHDFDQRSYVENHRYAATANLVVPRPTLDAVGTFDDSLRSGGDLDWGGRLHAAGRRMSYAADAVVDHPSRSSWRELTVKTVRVGDGLASLTAGQSLAADLRYMAQQVWHSLRAAATVRHRDELPTVSTRVRYVSAFTWTRVVWIAVRLRARVAAAVSRRTGVHS